MIKLMLINNQPDIAVAACAAGVDRVFLDLERHGKEARQGHLSTWISHHQMADVNVLRDAIDKSRHSGELLVRLNPIYEQTKTEVDDAIARGAEILMLPMVKSADDVARFAEYVSDRAKFVPLIETVSAMNDMSNIVNVAGVTEIYIGLNDLHLDMQCDFMFEPLANGMVDKAVDLIRAKNLPFGFGGIARVGEGDLPAEKILAEHVRLGSSCVILSRTFHRMAGDLQALQGDMDLASEIAKIRQAETQYQQMSKAELLACAEDLKQIVNNICHQKREAKHEKTV